MSLISEISRIRQVMGLNEEVKTKGEINSPLFDDTGMLISSVIKISASFVHLDEIMDNGKY